MDFKDKLINNKWKFYENKLTQSLINEYDIDLEQAIIKWKATNNRKEYIKNLSDLHNNYENKYHNCTRGHCYNSVHQYYNFSEDKINIKYNHFKNRKLTKKSLIKEHLWYNLKNEESIIISGDYLIITEEHDTHIKYLPKTPNSLKLNDIPVSYIDIIKKYHDTIGLQCNKLYFVFDMSTYCDVIDQILIMNKKKNKQNYFSYLPLEIIKHILYLTSIN